MDINFIDIKIFFALINNGNPFSINIKFKNFSDNVIFRKMVEIWVNSWIDRETIGPELTVFSIINNFNDPISKNFVFSWNFFDQNVVLNCINEDQFVLFLDFEVKFFEMFVENFDLNLSTIITNPCFVEKFATANCYEKFSFYWGNDRSCCFDSSLGCIQPCIHLPSN